MIDTIAVSQTLAGRWILLPLIPQDGAKMEFPDYGNLAQQVQKIRPGQLIHVWSPEATTDPIQTSAFNSYVNDIRTTRTQNDSLLKLLCGNSNAKVLFAPMISSHLFGKTSNGNFERKITMQFKALDYQTGLLMLRGSAAIVHEAKDANDVLTAPQLLPQLFLAIASKLQYNPVAGLAPSTVPDF